jgi:glucan-binding YG repeat protein
MLPFAYLFIFEKTAVIIQTKVRQTQCRLVLQHKKRDRQLYYAATCLQKRYRGVQGRIQARQEIEKQQRLMAIEKEKQRQLKRMEEKKRKIEENRILEIERNKIKIIQRKEKEKKERIETEKKQKAMKQREIEAQLIEREWKKRLVADKKLKREQLKNQKLLDDISRKETEEAYTAFLNEQKSKSIPTPAQKKKKKNNTSSTTATKDTNTYRGTLLLDNTVQVFWPSRVCNYEGVITTVLPSSATNGMVYKIKYNFDNSIRTYEEKELRQNIYNSYRFVMFMNRFINSISNAITNQRTIFGVTITSFDDLFQALDRNRYVFKATQEQCSCNSR